MRTPALQLTRLASERERAGLTSTELAQRAGLSAEALERVEAGQGAHLHTAVRLAQALGVEWRALVGDKSWREFSTLW